MGTERITGKFLLNKLLLAFDFDKGYLYTFKELLLKPGITVLNYINGERKIINPLNYGVFVIIVLLLISYVADLFFPNRIGIGIGSDNNVKISFFIDMLSFSLIASFFSYFILKNKFNFFEVLTLFSYTIFQFLIYSLIFSLILDQLYVLLINDISLKYLAFIKSLIILFVFIVWFMFVFKDFSVSFFKKFGLISICIISLYFSFFISIIINPYIQGYTPARVGIHYTTVKTMDSKLEIDNYLLIDSIFRNSAAETSGLKLGDVILKINTEKTSLGLFSLQTKIYNPGETILFEVKRGDKILHIPLTLKHKDSIKNFND